ncbi:MAG: porin family protein [Flavitalea sp.]
METKTISLKTFSLKAITLLAVAVFITTFSHAQGFHLGLKGGANLVKMESKSFKQGFESGYNFGGFAEINFSKKLGIQPEVLWNQTNTKTSEKFGDLYDEGISELKNVKLNYLSIPVLLNFSPSKTVTFQAGPQFGILLNKDQDLLQNGKAAFKSGDLSMLGGVQLNLGGFKVGGRYAVGLSNINDIDNQEQWKSRSWQLYVGFRLL